MSYPIYKRRSCPGRIFLVSETQSSGVRSSRQSPRYPLCWPDLRYTSPSRKKKKSPWEPAHPAHSPRLQTQHALTTRTGAYAETTFPFRISAGAMTFKSPPLTMDTDKIEVRLSPLLRGTAQHTCLATAQAYTSTAPASPPPHTTEENARAQSRRTEDP